MRRSLVSLLAVASLSNVWCADSPEATETDEGNFAVNQLSEDLSVLPAIEASNGKPDVCVGLIGFSDSKREAAKQKVAALVTDATSKWNALLEGNDEWTVHGAIAPKFRFRTTECPRTGPGFNVNVWATAAKFRADYCSRAGNTCASGANARNRTLNLGPVNRDEPADPFDPFATLHEYGHLLGLGDTYRIEGANDWVGEQPDSVMSGGSDTLTEDDKLGLWVVLRTLKTGVRSCTGFGTRVRMTHNYWNTLVCDPTSRPERRHR